MKIMTVVGARPQFVKVAAVSRLINTHKYQGINEVIVHTGQHYDQNMSQSFFQELQIPDPTYNLSVGSGSQGAQTGAIMMKLEELVEKESPDWMLVYGDTNSTLAGALVAAKTPVRLAHVESGLRSFHWGMAEEVNRVITDRLSDILFCPSNTAYENLLSEGCKGEFYMTGDVGYDSFIYYSKKVEHDSILQNLNLNKKKYILTTLHRAENTNNPKILSDILSVLRSLSLRVKVILPIHPRTKKVIEKYSISTEGLHIIDPVSYLIMIALLTNARIVITDSGGLQKESYFAKVPCITLRDETEWIETLENGWNRLVSPNDCNTIRSTAEMLLQVDFTNKIYLESYGTGEASTKILDILINHS
jgi:UDP-GlcNAc3NAcA epimerase